MISRESYEDKLNDLEEGFLAKQPHTVIDIPTGDLPTSGDPEEILQWVGENPETAAQLKKATEQLKNLTAQSDSDEQDYIIRIPKTAFEADEDAEEDSLEFSEEDLLIPQEQEQSRCQKIGSKTLKVAIYTVPLVNAALEAMDTTLGLSSKPLGLNVPVSLVHFFSALGINIKYDVAGANDVILLIKTKKIPESWAQNLSHRQEVLAASLATFLTSLSCFADSVQNYHFAMELPQKMHFDKAKYFSAKAWMGVAITGAVYTAISIILGEGIATWKESRDLVKGIKREYSCELSRYVSGILGRSLAVSDSLSDATFSYSGLQYILQVENTLALYALATGSLLSAITHYTTDGNTIVDNMDDFFGAFILKEGQEKIAAKDPQNIVSFVLSASAGGVFGYAMEYLIRDTMNEILDVLPFQYPALTKPLIEVLAYSGAAASFVKSAGNLFPFVHAITGKAAEACQSLYQKARGCLCDNDNVQEVYPGLLDLDDHMEDSADVLYFEDSEEASSKNVQAQPADADNLANELERLRIANHLLAVYAREQATITQLARQARFFATRQTRALNDSAQNTQAAQSGDNLKISH